MFNKMFDKLLQLYYKITKEEYEIVVVEYDKEGLMSNSFTINLKKIIKINNTYLKGIDIEGNAYTKSSVNPFNYTIRKIY
tara:strand:- start:123 stop:362 length:240 start_codon:yes stop_codon:yes gene_type:complete